MPDVISAGGLLVPGKVSGNLIITNCDEGTEC
jgi:hypothetical protein